MLKHYLVYLPLVPGSLEEEWDQCKKQILETFPEGIRSPSFKIFRWYRKKRYWSFLTRLHQIKSKFAPESSYHSDF